MSIDETAWLLSGQMVRNRRGTFYFDQPGSWVNDDGLPIWKHLHRLDGPAALWSDGSQVWYLNGLRHRLDGPAVIYAYGTQEWWANGQQHRTDGPAVIYVSGTQEWYVNGVRTK